MLMFFIILWFCSDSKNEFRTKWHSFIFFISFEEIILFGINRKFYPSTTPKFRKRKVWHNTVLVSILRHLNNFHFYIFSVSFHQIFIYAVPKIKPSKTLHLKCLSLNLWKMSKEQFYNYSCSIINLASTTKIWYNLQ